MRRNLNDPIISSGEIKPCQITEQKLVHPKVTSIDFALLLHLEERINTNRVMIFCMASHKSPPFVSPVEREGCFYSTWLQPRQTFVCIVLLSRVSGLSFVSQSRVRLMPRTFPFRVIQKQRLSLPPRGALMVPLPQRG